MIERSVNLLDVIGVSTESFQLNLTLIFPVMLALLLFRYSYLPSAAAELHSLPFTRGMEVTGFAGHVEKLYN